MKIDSFFSDTWRSGGNFPVTCTLITVLRKTKMGIYLCLEHAAGIAT